LAGAVLAGALLAGALLAGALLDRDGGGRGLHRERQRIVWAQR
jgi:hypothetical protein